MADVAQTLNKELLVLELYLPANDRAADVDDVTLLDEAKDKTKADGVIEGLVIHEVTNKSNFVLVGVIKAPVLDPDHLLQQQIDILVKSKVGAVAVQELLKQAVNHIADVI